MRLFDFNRAIIRQPGRSVVHGLRSGSDPDPSFEVLEAQHRRYVEVLASTGVEVTQLPAIEAFPDSVFVEDPALVFTEGAILLRPGAASRRDEGEQLAPALREAFGTLLSLPQGHADGGDILVTPGTVFIGLSARTDRMGAESLAALLQAWGYRPVIVQPPSGTLHLKTAASLIDDETILATRAISESGLFAGFRMVVVPETEEGGANALRSNAHLLAGSEYPRTLDLLDAHGAQVVAVDISEIAKIDAGLTCMSLRWRAESKGSVLRDLAEPSKG